MNQQSYNALKNLVVQHKADQKAFIDLVELHMATDDKGHPDLTKFTAVTKQLVENQGMIKSLICRLWAA